jgi:hypothetical protein
MLAHWPVLLLLPVLGPLLECGAGTPLQGSSMDGDMSLCQIQRRTSVSLQQRVKNTLIQKYNAPSLQVLLKTVMIKRTPQCSKAGRATKLDNTL